MNHYIRCFFIMGLFVCVPLTVSAMDMRTGKGASQVASPEQQIFIALCESIVTNNKQSFYTLLRVQKDINMPSPIGGRTLLMIACEMGSLSMVKALLVKGANPCQADNDRRSTFCYVLVNKEPKKRKELTELLLKYVDIANKTGKRTAVQHKKVVTTLLEEAALWGNTTVLDLIRVKTNIFSEQGSCSAQLASIATSSGQLEVLNFLVDHGFVRHDDAFSAVSSAGLCVVQEGSEYKKAESRASDSEDARVADLFFTIQNEKDFDKATTRILAALKKGVDINREILANKSDFTVTPLLMAIICDRTDIAQWLLSMGADPNKADNRGVNPAIMADVKKNFKILQELISAKGFNINHRIGNTTLLIVALECELDHLVLSLLDKGVDINMPAGDGTTPLMAVYDRTKNCEKVDMLLKRGALLDACNQNGDTLMHMAVKNGDASAVAFLLGKGARFDSANKQGQTALYMSQNEFPEISAMIKRVIRDKELILKRKKQQECFEAQLIGVAAGLQAGADAVAKKHKLHEAQLQLLQAKIAARAERDSEKKRRKQQRKAERLEQERLEHQQPELSISVVEQHEVKEEVPEHELKSKSTPESKKVFVSPAVTLNQLSLDEKLQQAVSNGFYGEAMGYLKNGANPYVGNPSAFDRAKSQERGDIVCSMSIMFNEPESYKAGLDQAALQGNMDYINILFGKYHKNAPVNTVDFPLVNSRFNIINTLNDQGETPMLTAVKSGHIRFANQLLQAFPIAAAGLYHKNNDQKTAVDFLLDPDKRIVIKRETRYSPDLLMSLCRKKEHEDSYEVCKLLTSLFPATLQPFVIPQGEYTGQQVLNQRTKNNYLAMARE